MKLYVCYGTWTAGGSVHKPGNYWVPLLVTGEGEAIQGSGKIIAWAHAHPAAAAA